MIPGGHQPYRKGTARKPGGALTNMMRGTTLHGQHPKDAMRAIQKAAKKRPPKRRRRRRARSTVRTLS